MVSKVSLETVRKKLVKFPRGITALELAKETGLGKTTVYETLEELANQYPSLAFKHGHLWFPEEPKGVIPSWEGQFFDKNQYLQELKPIIKENVEGDPFKAYNLLVHIVNLLHPSIKQKIQPEFQRVNAIIENTVDVDINWTLFKRKQTLKNLNADLINKISTLLHENMP